LLLEHPQVANTDCKTCKTFIFDPKTGTFAERRGVRQRRAKGQPTPCHECPKESPAKAKQYELSRKNWATVRLYLQHRAMKGAGLPDYIASDPIVRSNFAVIDTTFRQHESKRAANAVSRAIESKINRG